MNIAVLGCGRIGRMHAANAASHPRAELAVLYDLQRSAAEEVAAAHGAVVADSAEEIFRSPAIDAVLVASATESHAGYIEAAVAAGKPILCEKPIGLDLRRVNSLRDAIAGSTVPIQIGFNRRFDPGHRAAWEALRRGDIGELRQIVISSRDPSPPPADYLRASGGIFRDMTIHDFDMARFLLGDEPVAVFAAGSAHDLPPELDDFDTAMVTLSTVAGVQVQINNSRSSAYGYDQRIELLGSRGMLLSDNRAPHELSRFTAAGTRISEPYFYFFIERYREAYLAELDAFLECVEHGGSPPVGFDDGRRALVLAEAARLSIAERRVVDVEEIERLSC